MSHQGYTPGWLQYLADLKPYIPQEFLDGFFPAYIQASTYDGMLACLPRHADSQVIFYRADLFEDPKEQEAFKQEYGYDLKPPTNWQEADDRAKFHSSPRPIWHQHRRRG